MILASCIPDAKRKRYRLLAYVSAWTGCMSEVLFDSSAVVLLLLAVLGASESLTMLTTAFSPIAWSFLMLPCAELARRRGLKWSISAGCYCGMTGCFLAAASPWFGRAAVPVAVLGCAVFALSRPVHLAAWYPLLNGFLRREERGGFFGFMRFSYQMIAMALFFGIGLVMGKKPPVWMLQGVIAFCGLLLLGRKLTIDHVPEVRAAASAESGFRTHLRKTVLNGALMSFAVYCCGISFACSASLPLTILYLKKELCLGSGAVQIIAVAGTAGTMLGYLCFGRLLEKLRVRRLLVGSHLGIILTTAGLSLCVPQFRLTPVLCAVFLFGLHFAVSCYTNCFSTEMLALAAPGQQTMSTAICSAYSSFGGAIGRFSVSLALAGGMLAAAWDCAGISFSRFQTLELVCSAFALLLLVVLPTVPAVVPDRKDYYDGGEKSA